MLCQFRPAAALADLDDDMLEELVSSYHFGGGADGQQRGTDDGQGGQRRPLTKKEVGGTSNTKACEEPVSHKLITQDGSISTHICMQ
jgi:hypothetical protein